MEISTLNTKFNSKPINCSQSYNFDIFNPTAEQILHFKSCQVCSKKVNDFNDSLKNLKKLKVETYLNKKEKRIIFTVILKNIQTDISEIFSMIIPVFRFIEVVTKDLFSVIFSIKTALLVSGVMVLSLLTRLLFN